METPNPKKAGNSWCCFFGVVKTASNTPLSSVEKAGSPQKFSLLSKLGSCHSFSFHQPCSTLGGGPSWNWASIGCKFFVFFAPWFGDFKTSMGLHLQGTNIHRLKSAGLEGRFFGNVPRRGPVTGPDHGPIPSWETWPRLNVTDSQGLSEKRRGKMYILSSLYGLTLPNSTTSTIWHIWPCRLLVITPGHWHKTNKHISVQPKVQSNKIAFNK